MKFHASMRIILLACLFVGILSSCSHNRAVSALDSSLDSLFTSIFPDPEAPGAIVLVAKGDTILFDRGYGMADLKNGKAICDTTLFNICSISKQFAAVALLKLEEQGKLDLDDHVGKFIPALRLPQFSEVTLFTSCRIPRVFPTAVRAPTKNGPSMSSTMRQVSVRAATISFIRLLPNR